MIRGVEARRRRRSESVRCASIFDSSTSFPIRSGEVDGMMGAVLMAFLALMNAIACYRTICYTLSIIGRTTERPEGSSRSPDASISEMGGNLRDDDATATNPLVRLVFSVTE